MPKDLLEKFDRVFDEQFEYKQWNESDSGFFVLIDKADGNPMAIEQVKSLAHSHLEEAYRAGVKAQCVCSETASKNCVVHQNLNQSNLERLIEKLPKTIDIKGSADGFGRFSLLWDEKGWRAGYNEMIPYEGEFLTKECFGSTPTEAVENLIKALNKQ